MHQYSINHIPLRKDDNAIRLALWYDPWLSSKFFFDFVNKKVSPQNTLVNRLIPDYNEIVTGHHYDNVV